MVQWKFEDSGNVSAVLLSLISPFTDPIIAGALSVALAVGFDMGKFAFTTAATIVSFTFVLRVL